MPTGNLEKINADILTEGVIQVVNIFIKSWSKSSLKDVLDKVAKEAGNQFIHLAHQDNIQNNNDLMKVVRSSIVVALQEAAESQEFPAYTKELHKLAQIAVQNQFSSDKQLNLENFISDQSKLDTDGWNKILDGVSESAGVTLPQYVSLNVSLSLKKNFSKLLRAVLKDDFEKGGKEFAGLVSSICSVINPESLDNPVKIKRKLDTIIQLTPEESRTKASFRDLAAKLDFKVQDSSQDIDLQDLRIRKLLKAVETTPKEIKNLSEVLEEIDSRKVQPDFPGITDSPLPSPDKPAKEMNYWEGRNPELEQLPNWLENKNIRLIGIEGLGGIGKSTLVKKIYNQPQGFDAKYWVDVSHKLDFSEFAKQVLKKLDNRPQDVEKIPEAQLSDALVNCLRDGQYLLVIDNLETLLKPDGQWQDELYKTFFDRWLKSGGKSKVIITTREQPIPTAVNTRWLQLQGLEISEGINLLQNLEIKHSEAELKSLVERVEGHPLALRLMASFLKQKGQNHFPKLDKSNIVRLLSDSDIPGMHQDKENVKRLSSLEGIFSRLSPKLQKLFLNLSVYQDRFNQAAAAALLPEEKIDNSDLIQLVEKRLLEKPTNENGEQCFKFQRFTKTYAQLRAGDQTKAHERAIDYYKSLAKTPPFQREEDLKEHREIFYHYCQMKRYDLAFDTIAIFDKFLDLQGYNTLRVTLYKELVEEWEPSKEEKSKFMLSFYALANAYCFLSEYPKAIKYYQQTLDVAREINDRQREAKALNRLGRVYSTLGNYGRAIDCHKKSQELFQEIGDSGGKAASLSNLGNVLSNLGNVYSLIGKYKLAVKDCTEALKIKQEIGDREGEIYALVNLGNVYQLSRKYDGAIKCHEQALKIAREIKNRLWEATSLNNLGKAHNSLGEYDKAISHHEQALNIAREIKNRQIKANALGNLGRTHLSLGQYDQAIDYCKQQIEIAQELGDRLGEANCLSTLGDVYSAKKEYHNAINYHQESVEIRQEIGDRQGEAEELQKIAIASLKKLNVPQGLKAQKEAKQISKKLERPVEGLPKLGLRFVQNKVNSNKQMFLES
jgi:tetratricopeptide (TPR) repeat protein